MVLVAPLNWGLGHASRCIPIIRHLVINKIPVLLASDGAALSMLRQEFPSLPYKTLPSYGTDYKTPYLALNLARQLPTLMRAIREEHQLLMSWIKENNITAIISDNRFGLHCKALPTVFITHQVNIPIHIPGLHQLANRLNHRFINKFQQIWVPDYAGQPNLTGPMSHGTPLEHKITFLGPISRMPALPLRKKYDILIVLSGTEPQRTILEHKLLHQLAQTTFKTLLIQGKPGVTEFPLQCTPNLEILPYLKSSDLIERFSESELIISRSGYTTVMDLIASGKKALLIPTPGQREQEFLAKHFDNQGIFAGVAQSQLNLLRDVPRALQMHGPTHLPYHPDDLHQHLDYWLTQNTISPLTSQDEITPERAIA
jgi:uncharacterized protein (TIGR00661 family)